MDFVAAVTKFVKTRSLANYVDYFNYRFIPGFILSCTFLMTYKQYATKPIACFTQNIPIGIGFDDYIQNFCYLTDKYSTHKIGDDFTWETAKKSTITINIYMWFPIILLIQAISFCIRNGFWFYFGKQVDSNYIIDICFKPSLEDTSEKKYARL